MASIQIIKSCTGKKIENGITFSKLSEPRSLDEFDINIIDFNGKEFWRNDRFDSTKIVNDQQDIENLGLMIDKRKGSQVIICLPQDQKFFTDLDRLNSKYIYCYDLKNLLKDVENILHPLFGQVDALRLVYEKTVTKIGSIEIGASFYFDDENHQVADRLTRSDKSEKTTTVKFNDSSAVKELYATTLDITSLDGGDLLEYLRAISLIQEGSTVPDWLYELKMFDDNRQEEIIAASRAVISKNEEVIRQATIKINENLRYKSILYTNGDELVKVVFEILEAILAVDLSPFIDTKKEDFNIAMDGVTFIGEIKGVTSNVKSEHISQLDVHCQSYIDELQNQGREENVKGLLIINHQRGKRLPEREAIFDKQIQLAERNGSLIIETRTLLKIFEQYRNGDMTAEACSELLKDNTGLLKI